MLEHGAVLSVEDIQLLLVGGLSVFCIRSVLDRQLLRLSLAAFFPAGARHDDHVRHNLLQAEHLLLARIEVPLARRNARYVVDGAGAVQAGLDVFLVDAEAVLFKLVQVLDFALQLANH